MDAFDELAVQCARRGWRLGLDGSYPNGVLGDGFEVTFLEVRTRAAGELLAHIPCDAADLDGAAVEASRALQAQGLLA